MIRAVEDNILKALEADTAVAGSPLAVMQIERCPEDFSERSMSSSFGAVWVHFAGIDSSEMAGAGGGIQDDVYFFDVYVITRNLRPGHVAAVTDSGSAYDVIPRVREILTGFQPAPGFKPMYMAKTVLSAKSDAFWQYAMRFAAKGRYFYEKQDSVAGISKKMVFEGTDRTITIQKEEV